MVLNDVGQAGIGFDAAENEVTVLEAGGTDTPLPRAAKERIADGILDRVQALWQREEDEDVGGAHPDRAARV